MAFVEAFATIVSLWLASSAVALVALVGLYMAERARGRGVEAERPEEGETVAETGDAGRS